MMASKEYQMQAILILITFLFSEHEAFGQQSLTLTASYNVSFCPGPVVFNCNGTQIQFVLKWRVNDTAVGGYSFDPSHANTYPRNVTTSLPGVEIEIINGVLNQDNTATSDINSTLRADASILRGSTVQCYFSDVASNVTSDVYAVKEVLDSPTSPSSTSCSLLISPGDPGISLQWNSSFNSQYAVEMYRVRVVPNLPTCSQNLNVSEDYSCPGLALGTEYSFTVNAINCGNQEGIEYTFTVQPQVPQNIANFEVEPIYDSSSQLREVRVSWSNQPPSISERCDYDRTVNYTVVLVSSTGERVDQRTVSSDSCTDGQCSTSFSPSSSDQTYHVSVSATNVFGESSSTSSVTFNGSSSFSHSLTFDNCITTLLCSYQSSEGQCFIEYSKDPSYQDLSPPIQGPLNSPFTLPLMDENTFYYYLVNNTFGIQFTGNFTTGEFAVRLTPTNQVLLVMGVILLSIATIVGIVLIVVDVRIHKGSRLFLIVLVVGCAVVVLSIVLWVAVGFQVGLQKNTCDTNWQFTRDSLIITTFIFSLLSTLIIIAAGILSAIGYFKQDFVKNSFLHATDNEHKYDRKESWWHNLLTPRHITSTGRNEVEPETWEIALEEHKDKLTKWKGGSIKVLEEVELATEGFREVGEKYLDAKLRTRETIFQEYTAKKAEDESKEVYSVTQHNNTPQVKVNPQDSNYSHLNRPGASVQGDSHYLSLNHEKGVSEAKKKDKSTSSPQGQKKDVPGGGEYDVPGGGEYDVPDNKSKKVYSVTQHNNTPQVKVNPQDSNYSHMNKPGASMGENGHYFPLNHDKGGSKARNKDKLTSAPQVGGGAGDSIQKRGVPGGEEYDVLNNKKTVSSEGEPAADSKTGFVILDRMRQ